MKIKMSHLLFILKSLVLCRLKYYQSTQSHSLINKAVLSIKAYVSEKHMIFSGHYTPLSCTGGALHQLLRFPIRRKDEAQLPQTSLTLKIKYERVFLLQ